MSRLKGREFVQAANLVVAPALPDHVSMPLLKHSERQQEKGAKKSNMQQTLFLILATSMWTIGLHMAAREGEILERVNRFTTWLFGEYWNSPILGCPYCMPSLHGIFVTGVYHLYYGFPHEWWWYAIQYIFIVPSSSFLNYILYNLIRILRGYAALFDEPEPEEKKKRKYRTKLK